MMKKPEGVILDLDATLIDSLDGRVQSWAEALKQHGYPVGVDELRPLFGLVPGELLLRTTGLGEDTELGRKIRDRARQIFLKRYVARLYPTYRALELLARLEAEGFRLGVVTTDGVDVLIPMLKLVGLETLATRAATAPAEGSPSQRELVKLAVERVGLAPGKAAILTASPHFADAAEKLGVGVLALRSAGFTRFPASAAVFGDARELWTEFARSPLGASAA